MTVQRRGILFRARCDAVKKHMIWAGHHWRPVQMTHDRIFMRRYTAENCFVGLPHLPACQPTVVDDAGLEALPGHEKMGSGPSTCGPCSDTHSWGMPSHAVFRTPTPACLSALSGNAGFGDRCQVTKKCWMRAAPRSVALLQISCDFTQNDGDVVKFVKLGVYPVKLGVYPVKLGVYPVKLGVDTVKPSVYL